MNLTIKKLDKNTANIDGDMFLNTSLIAMQATHLFIASNKWDTVTVELDSSIPKGYLKYIPIVAQKVCVKLNKHVDSDSLHQLCELYPDRAGVLRRIYMANKDVLEALPPCSVV